MNVIFTALSHNRVLRERGYSQPPTVALLFEKQSRAGIVGVNPSKTDAHYTLQYINGNTLHADHDHVIGR